jgi:hypothetical protein
MLVPGNGALTRDFAIQITIQRRPRIRARANGADEERF